MTETNLYSSAFGTDLAFMDGFHDYPEHSNVRYYHRLKASIVRDFIARQAALLRENSPKGPLEFLDAGGGTGPYCRLAYEAGAFGKIHLLEFDAQELDRARRNLAGIMAIDAAQADLRAIPLPDNSIATAVCSEVLEHIPNEELAAKELFRVMKPGGTLLFSMPNAASLFYKNVKKRMPKDLLAASMDSLPYPDWERRRHISFPASSIRAILTTAGFELGRSYGANVIPLPVSIRERLEGMPLLFRTVCAINSFLGKMMPGFGSFYFVEAIKPVADQSNT